MSQTAVALLALAALISVGQWLWARAVPHIDPRLIHGHARRHVQWLQANSRYVQVLALVLALSAAGAGLSGA